MKWIKFEDMWPPVGMNVFISCRGAVSIINWEKKYDEDNSELVSVYSDTWSRPREIYDLDFWAPVSFFEEHLPDAFEQEDLKPEKDWFLQHKNHQNIEKIRDITKDLFQKNNKELSELVPVPHGWSSYGYLKREQVSDLFEQINYPYRKRERRTDELSLKEGLQFNEKLLSVPTPNLITKVFSNKKRDKE